MANLGEVDLGSRFDRTWDPETVLWGHGGGLGELAEFIRNFSVGETVADLWGSLG